MLFWALSDDSLHRLSCHSSAATGEGIVTRVPGAVSVAEDDTHRQLLGGSAWVTSSPGRRSRQSRQRVPWDPGC